MNFDDEGTFWAVFLAVWAIQTVVFLILSIKTQEDIFGCLAVFGGIPLFFILMFVFVYLQNISKVISVKAAIESTKTQKENLRAFAMEQIPDLGQALREADKMQALYEDASWKLGVALDKFSIERAKDPEYAVWTNAEFLVRTEQQNLETKIEDIYLLKKKFELAPSDDLKGQINQLVAQGKASCDNISRYQAEMMNQK